MTALAISNIVLRIVVLALLAVVLALTRQLGVLHERIAPVGALMLNRGLAVGEKAPAVDVDDLNGGRLKVGAPRSDGKSTLLLFVSPTCPVCKSLLPIVKSSGKDERDWLTSSWLATGIRTSIASLPARTGSGACRTWFRRRWE